MTPERVKKMEDALAESKRLQALMNELEMAKKKVFEMEAMEILFDGSSPRFRFGRDWSSGPQWSREILDLIPDFKAAMHNLLHEKLLQVTTKFQDLED